MQKNEAFFRLYENMFLVLKEGFGEEKALEIFRKIIEFGLKKAYDASCFEKGNPDSFAKVVGERDRNVGLEVKFIVKEDEIIYRFHTDPFPNLKDHVSHEKLDDTYMRFKVEYLLGSEWTYKNTNHMWDGDEFTGFVIRKKVVGLAGVEPATSTV